MSSTLIVLIAIALIAIVVYFIRRNKEWPDILDASDSDFDAWLASNPNYGKLPVSVYQVPGIKKADIDKRRRDEQESLSVAWTPPSSSDYYSSSPDTSSDTSFSGDGGGGSTGSWND